MDSLSVQVQQWKEVDMSDQPAPHDPVPLEPVDHTIVATWPVGTFIENIAVMADGSFVISVHNRCEVLHVSRAGASTRLAILPFSPAGLVATSDGVFAVAGKPSQSPHRLFKVGLDGSVEERMQVPDTLFLNGLTPARLGCAYTVDSILGVVIELDLDGSSSRVVLRDERLTKCSPDPMVPGANGIKVGDNALFITSTDRALVLRAELGSDGPTGTLSTVAEHLRGDDLALDEVGNLYIANHIHNTLIRLRPNGERIAIAGPDQGMAGSTACVFASDDPGGLYVTATGGITMPIDGVVQEAKLVRLETDARGRPIVVQP